MSDCFSSSLSSSSKSPSAQRSISLKLFCVRQQINESNTCMHNTTHVHVDFCGGPDLCVIALNIAFIFLFRLCFSVDRFNTCWFFVFAFILRVTAYYLSFASRSPPTHFLETFFLVRSTPLWPWTWKKRSTLVVYFCYTCFNFELKIINCHHRLCPLSIFVVLSRCNQNVLLEELSGPTPGMPFRMTCSVCQTLRSRASFL